MNKWRQDFPALQQLVHGKPLVYLDSAATAQKPQAVIDAISHYYAHDNANVHRGVHQLSERSTLAYDRVRAHVATWLGAAKAGEIIFTQGTTDAINLIAHSFGPLVVGEGDTILISVMEHHANIVPWQQLAQRVGARVEAVGLTSQGELDLQDLEQQLSSGRVKLLSLTHVSNVLGTVNPIAQIIAMAKAQGIPVVVDGAQAPPHMRVDVQALDCDFYAFSAHKCYGPTGLGVLYAKEIYLERMPPYQTGGGMIAEVTIEHSSFQEAPQRFEAGTPHIAGVVGLGAALDYIERIGYDAIAAHGDALVQAAHVQLAALPGVNLLGQPGHRVGSIAFTVDGIHAHDVATLLDQQGVAVRAGHHCCMPLMQHYGVAATARASFGLYNQLSDIDALVSALHHAQEVFGL